MALKCGRCGSESVDGTVFCDVCGARIVVGVPDGYSEDAPFYAYQFMGQTRLFSFAGWAIRWFAPQLLVLLGIAVVAASAGREGIPMLVLALSLGAAYFLVWALLIRSYRCKGRPTDFGGAGPPTSPSADAASAIESDFGRPSGSEGTREPGDPGSSYALLPKRR